MAALSRELHRLNKCPKTLIFRSDFPQTPTPPSTRLYAGAHVSGLPGRVQKELARIDVRGECDILFAFVENGEWRLIERVRQRLIFKSHHSFDQSQIDSCKIIVRQWRKTPIHL